MANSLLAAVIWCAAFSTEARGEQRAVVLMAERNHTEARGEPRAVVLMAERNHEKMAMVASQALRSLLHDLDVSFILRWVPKVPRRAGAQLRAAARMARKEGAILVVWCDFSIIERIYIYSEEESHGGRIRVREVTSAKDGQYGRFEAMALIVRSSLEAIMSEHKDDSWVVDSNAEGSPSITIAAGYAVRGFSDPWSVYHVGLASVGISFLTHWSIMVEYGLRSEMNVSTALLRYSLRGHDLRIRGTFDWAFGRFLLGVQLAVGVGLLPWHVSAKQTNVRTVSEKTDVTLGVEAGLRLGLSISSWLQLYTGPGAAFMLVNQQYAVEVSGQKRQLLRPLDIQPFWVFGVSVSPSR